MDIKFWSDKFELDMSVKRYDEDGTIPNYSCQIKMFLARFSPRFNHPKHISAEEIKSYLVSKEVINTQKHAHSAIKLFYKLTVHQEFKFRFIEYAKKDKKLPEILEREEIQSLLKVCENKKHKLIMIILYACGLRISELINLKLIHINNDTIDIKLAKGRKDRIVQLPEKVKQRINEYIAEYNPTEYLFNGQFPDRELRYSERSINEFLKKYAKLAGIKTEISAHKLRHCYATHTLEDGTTLPFLQEMLGHNSPKTTSIYIHASRRSIARQSSPVDTMEY